MRKNGVSTGGIVTIIIVLAILVIGTILVVNRNSVDYSGYASETVIGEVEDNGMIADHVIGSSEAPVVIHEYANFQCNHCADIAPVIKKTAEESDGKLAVVFRNFTWSSFQNSRAAAAAAEAAGLQGYWAEYAQKLFENQAEWASATGDERTNLFNQYFEEVSGGQGNMEQFAADIASDAVTKKIDFDIGLGEAAGVDGTPALFLEDGQRIALDGGELTIGDQTISYEGFESGDDLAELLKKIVAAKTGA